MILSEQISFCKRFNFNDVWNIHGNVFYSFSFELIDINCYQYRFYAFQTSTIKVFPHRFRFDLYRSFSILQCLNATDLAVLNPWEISLLIPLRPTFLPFFILRFFFNRLPYVFHPFPLRFS